jgi:hypothetical protein
MTMPEYRAYTVGPDGHVLGAPAILTADDDQKAVEKAQSLVDGHDVELWTGAGARFVTTIKPEKVWDGPIPGHLQHAPSREDRQGS